MRAIFSKRAIASMNVDIEFSKNSKRESGGVLLGQIQSDDFYIIENVCPGFEAVCTPVKFEYQDSFVNYLANHYAMMYDKPLSLIGLWHTHVDGAGIFSPTDRKVNHSYFSVLKHQFISAIVVLNQGEKSLNVYIADSLHEERINYSIGDQYIPAEFLKYS